MKTKSLCMLVQPSARLAILLIVSWQLTAQANPGDLDSSFGGAGKVRTGFDGGPGSGRAVAWQADGKLVLAGFSQRNSTNCMFALVRFGTNNLLDASFGASGAVLTSIGFSNNAAANAMRIQGDGKIIAAGYAENSAGYDDFALARYNPDGSLDASFGNAGIVITSLGIFTPGGINAMLLQADGKIIVGGNYSQLLFNGTSGFALARYDTNGVLDATFGNGGIATTDFNGGVINGLTFQSDRKIIAAGTAGSDFALARYDINGVLDATFGGGGRVFTPVGYYVSFFGGYAAAHAVAMQLGNFTVQNPDKIVAAGQADVSFGTSGFAVVRYNLDGSLDTTFGNGGIVTNVFDAGGSFINSYGEALVVQGTLIQPRKITVGGYGFNTGSNTSYFAMARLNADGSFDSTFGPNSNGKVTLAFGAGGDDEAYALTTQGGQIVLGGLSVQTNYQTDFAAARFNSSGLLDPAFGSGGVVTAGTDLGSRARGIAMQRDGKMLVAGSADTGAATDFALARYNPDGSLDGSFGTNMGKVTIPVGPGNAAANASLLQPDGKILAAGCSYNGTNNNFAVVRCKTNGVLDAAFGGTGAVITAIGSSNAVANAGAIQSDGKIILAGYGFNGLNQDFAVARYTTNGALDGSFGGTGIVLTGIGSGGAKAAALQIQADGKIVAAGQTLVGAGTDFAVVRYTTNGLLDTSFGLLGRVTTDFGSGTTAYGFAMAIQPDGRILVAGGAVIGGTEYVGLARYTTNGVLDATFGFGGEVVRCVEWEATCEQPLTIGYCPDCGRKAMAIIWLLLLQLRRFSGCEFGNPHPRLRAIPAECHGSPVGDTIRA